MSRERIEASSITVPRPCQGTSPPADTIESFSVIPCDIALPRFWIYCRTEIYSTDGGMSSPPRRSQRGYPVFMLKILSLGPFHSFLEILKRTIERESVREIAYYDNRFVCHHCHLSSISSSLLGS